MSFSRREFLGALAVTPAIAAGADAGQTLPTRVLGRTGARVSILAFGGGSRFTQFKEDDAAIEALNRALEMGITYVDTAQGYGRGKSETRIGMALKGRRKGIFIATKIEARKADDALRNFEESLKRLQTDQIDLVHVHSLEDDDDLAAVEAKDGVLSALYKLREQKAARFIGVTSHSYPSTLKKALERHDFDCTQMALNAALIGMASGKGGMVPNPKVKESFETIALPVANRKKMGVIAMKIYAQEKLSGEAPAEKLLGYALSLPVTAAVVGMPTLDYIDRNVQIARSFKPLSKGEMRGLSRNLSGQFKMAHDEFFVRHIDA